MLVVETIARIRRARFVRGKSIKAICRELRASQKAVRKVLRSEATEFRYERARQPTPRLGAWRGELDRLLAAGEAPPGAIRHAIADTREGRAEPPRLRRTTGSAGSPCWSGAGSARSGAARSPAP